MGHGDCFQMCLGIPGIGRSLLCFQTRIHFIISLLHKKFSLRATLNILPSQVGYYLNRPLIFLKLFIVATLLSIREWIWIQQNRKPGILFIFWFLSVRHIILTN